MSDKKKKLFKKILRAFPEDADEIAKLFKVSKRSLAAYKANMNR